MTWLLAKFRRYPIAMAAPAAVIIATSLLAVAGSNWYLTGDFAHTEFLVRAIPRHPPLIGVAARVQQNGSTPGPSMAYLLYPFYKLFGSNAFALAAAVNVLHLAAIVGTVMVARRVGGTSIAAFTAVSLTVTSMAVAPRFFLEPWNVWVPVFAFALFLVLIWGLLCEHLVLLPIAVAVGSHCVQTHISYTLMVTGLLGGTMTWLGWLWWRTDRLAELHPLRWLLIAGATLIVVWLPPVVEQLRPGTGNLRKLYHQFSDPAVPFVDTSVALKALVARFNLFGPWIVDALKEPRTEPNYIGFVLFVVLVGVSARWAWKRRQPIELRLYAVLAATTMLGLISTLRIFGDFLNYVLRWSSPLVAMWMAVCVWSCWLTWRSRSELSPARRTLGVATGGIVAITLGVTAIGVGRTVNAQVPYERDSRITGVLSSQLEDSLDRSKRYQINEFDPVALGSVAFGLALELDRQGLHAGVGRWGEAGVMPFRVVSDSSADSTLWYVATKPVIGAFTALPGAVVRASFDVRSPLEVQRSEQLETELLQVLCDEGRPELRQLLFVRWGHAALSLVPDLPPEAISLLKQYDTLRQVAAVVELPVGVDGFAVTTPVAACAG